MLTAPVTVFSMTAGFTPNASASRFAVIMRPIIEISAVRPRVTDVVFKVVGPDEEVLDADVPARSWFAYSGDPDRAFSTSACAVLA